MGLVPSAFAQIEDEVPDGTLVFSTNPAPAVYPVESEWVLALFWDESRNSFDIHGLWPQGAFYCGPDSARDIDAVWPEDVAARRLEVMTRAATGLDDHEWSKHGTCTPWDQATYWRESVRLFDEAQASPLRTFLGQESGAVTRAAWCGVIDAWLGAAHTWAIHPQIRDGVLSEVWFYLEPDENDHVALAPQNMLGVRPPNCRDNRSFSLD